MSAETPSTPVMPELTFAVPRAPPGLVYPVLSPAPAPVQCDPGDAIRPPGPAKDRDNIKRKREPIGFPRNQSEREKAHIKKRLKGFHWKESAAWHDITRFFGPGLSQEELLAIAEILASAAGLKTDREARRRKEVLIKWFDENYNVLRPMFDRLELYNGDERLELGSLSV